MQDEIGDAYKYCLAMAELAQGNGVRFQFEAAVSDFELARGKVTAVLSGEKRFTADQYVLAAGSFTSLLLRNLGIRIPVQPAKGYSLSFDRPPGVPLPRVSIVDDDYHAVVVALENVVRVAGTAEFAGYDLSLPEARIRNLRELLGQILPQLKLDGRRARPWCGLRPMSADGVPVIGRTPIRNLWINTGHGHLGWTLAAGSANLLSELLADNTPSVDPRCFALERFARSR